MTHEQRCFRRPRRVRGSTISGADVALVLAVRHAVGVQRFLKIVAVLAIVFLAMQIPSYGRDHTNPKTVKEVSWDSRATRALAVDACFACHSNLTEWPWYTSVAPLSWLTYRDVQDGRAKLNFSEWQRPQDVNLEEVVSAIRDKGMPPPQYRLIHREARLTAAQRQELEQGLLKTWASSPPGG